MKKLWAFPLCILFLVGSCKRASQTAAEIGARIHLKAGSEEEAVVPVKIVPAHWGSIKEKITIYGKIAPRRESLISSQFPGRLLDFHLFEGDRVQTGQILARIQSPKSEALLQGTKSLQGQQQSFSAEWMPIKLISPLSGIVVRRFHNLGDVISAGEPIVQILDDRTFYLWGQLPILYIKDVCVGQILEVSFPELPGLHLSTKIDAINSRVDPKTQMAQIRATLQNPHHLLKSGMFAQIEILLKSKEKALLVPREAVLGRREQPFVYCKASGRAHRRPVKLGIRSTSWIEVLQGIQPGDSVIVVGNYELKEGMRVKETF